MSKVKIQGNASGTGTVTVTAPNTNADRTITLPDSTGTLVGADANGNVGIGTSSISTNFRQETVGLAGSNTGPASSGTTQNASAVMRIRPGGGFTATLDIGQGGGTGSWLQSTDTSNLATTYPLLLNPIGGNVGIGVVPESDWISGGTSLSIEDGSLISNSSTGSGHWTSSNNAKQTVNNYTTGWNYKNTDEASQHVQVAGTHIFRVAPSGTADSAISWTTAMTIDNNGHSYIGAHSNQNHSNTGMQLAKHGELWISRGQADYIMRFGYQPTNTAVGSISVSSSSTAYNTSSDYRLKENVVPMSGSIDRLKQLKPSRFNFIADADTTVDGFLAHEAQDVVPEAITGTKDAMRTEEYEVTPAVMDGETVVTEAVMGEREVPDYQGIDQAKLVPLLTSALQDAIEKIEQLESRITAMEVS